MRVLLLLIILAQTAWIGNELGFIASHYEMLEQVYTQGLHNADKAIAYQQEELRKCRKHTSATAGTTSAP